MKLLVLGLVLCGGTAFAQYPTAGAGPYAVTGAAPSLLNNSGPSAPSAPDLGLRDGSITPTMQRQREERARLVQASFPNLQAQLEGRSWAQARRLYAAAEHRARWERINRQ